MEKPSPYLFCTTCHHKWLPPPAESTSLEFIADVFWGLWLVAGLLMGALVHIGAIILGPGLAITMLLLNHRRRRKRVVGCPSCQGLAVIPASSPRAQQVLAQGKPAPAGPSGNADAAAAFLRGDGADPHA